MSLITDRARETAANIARQKAREEQAKRDYEAALYSRLEALQHAILAEVQALDGETSRYGTFYCADPEGGIELLRVYCKSNTDKKILVLTLLGDIHRYEWNPSDECVANAEEPRVRAIVYQPRDGTTVKVTTYEKNGIVSAEAFIQSLGSSLAQWF